MKELWYVHVTHVNKPKNRLYGDLYALKPLEYERKP